MFPRFFDKRWGYVSLAAEFDALVASGTLSVTKEGGESPCLDPKNCAPLLDNLHRNYQIDYSYGGWLEDRSQLWKGSYMEKDKSFIHVGVDFNVPAGTNVRLPFYGTVLRKDDDTPEEHGWGGRIFVRNEIRQCVFIFAHLAASSILWGVGETLGNGAEIGQVGDSDCNGGWYPHLHVQAMSMRAYLKYGAKGFKGLDGYVSKENLPGALLEFFDPLPILHPF